MITEKDLPEIEQRFNAWCNDTQRITYVGGTIYLHDSGDVNAPFAGVALHIGFNGIGFRRIIVVPVTPVNTVDDVVDALQKQAEAKYKFVTSKQLPP